MWLEFLWRIVLLFNLCGHLLTHYFQLYLTDLHTRESVLLSTGEQPILQLALHDDSIWVASTDSSVHRWPAEACNPQKIFERGNSFIAGNLSYSRARVSLEGSTPVCYIYGYFSKILILLLHLLSVVLLWEYVMLVAYAHVKVKYICLFVSLPKKFLSKYKCSFD